MTLFQIITVCIYGSAIECFYDEQGNETEMVVMKAMKQYSQYCL